MLTSKDCTAIGFYLGTLERDLQDIYWKQNQIRIGKGPPPREETVYNLRTGEVKTFKSVEALDFEHDMIRREIEALLPKIAECAGQDIADEVEKTLVSAVAQLDPQIAMLTINEMTDIFEEIMMKD